MTNIPTPPLARRCLALSARFETGRAAPECFAALSGDFDGQGLGLGALQWNIGRGTLQPLLARMARDHPAVFDAAFADGAAPVRRMLTGSRAEQLAWARSIQSPRHVIAEPWAGWLKALGRTAEFQDIQVEAVADLFNGAVALARHYGLRSERAVALMFDIKVQNGSIPARVEAAIRAEFAALGGPPDALDAEVSLLRVVANRRADVAAKRWRDDVRRRKLAIADGAGTVHGHVVDLEADYGIGLRPAVIG
jgi:hypothetical protein